MAENFESTFKGSVADIESKKNKTNSICANPSDEKYPSEKAVKDYVDNNSGGGGVSEDILNDKIEQILNAWIEEYQPESKMDKVGELEVGSEDYYPNCIAVKNYVDDNAGGASEEVCWKVETKTVEVCYEATLEEDDEGNMEFVLTGNIVEPAEEYGPEDGSATVDGEQIYVGSLVVGDEGAREYEVFYVKRTETIYVRTPETVGPIDGKPLEGVFTETGEQVYSATTTEEKTAKYLVCMDVSTREVYDIIIPDDVIDKESIYSDAEGSLGEYDALYGEPVYWVTLTKDWYVDGVAWGYEGDEVPFVIREEEVVTTVYYTPLNVTDSFRIHKEYIDSNLGDIETALDSIIAIQEELIGGSGGGGTREITFNVDFSDGVRTYTAEKGMTWDAWFFSDYSANTEIETTEEGYIIIWTDDGSEVKLSSDFGTVRAWQTIYPDAGYYFAN